MYCAKCGNKIDEKDEFCSKCGSKIGQDNANGKKVKIKKHNKINLILLIILILLIHFILFAGGTRSFLNMDIVTADVIYPVNKSSISNGLTTQNTYECNIVYKYKGVEYHDKLTFNDDNLPEEIKYSSSNPYSFDVKLNGYVYKDNVNKFILDMEYYNISKYSFYIQVILIIPSLWLIIRNIINLSKSKKKMKMKRELTKLF